MGGASGSDDRPRGQHRFWQHRISGHLARDARLGRKVALKLIKGDGLGTLAYMAPEQWQLDEVGAAVDVWALGLILYELISGELPYGAHLAKLMDLALRVSSAEEVFTTLSALLERQGPSADAKASPFRGLLPFTERQAAPFFGRDAEIDALVEQLREVPVMTVVGKSSLVRAGTAGRLGRVHGLWCAKALLISWVETETTSLLRAEPEHLESAGLCGT